MMRDSTRRELHKLRELVHFLLVGAGATPVDDEVIGALCCFFCKQRLDGYAGDFSEHGNSIGPKFAAKLSIHHVNGDHVDNRDLNKALCHTKCHKSHHRTLANQKRVKTALTQLGVDPEPF